MRSHQSQSAWLTVQMTAIALVLGAAQTGAKENLKTESRAPYLHHIPLRDNQGSLITMPKSTTQPWRGNPYSTARSCSECHDYSRIGNGWHFNAAREGVPAGRSGEPWILTDPLSHTQLPMSYRGWKGTFKPSDVGIESKMTDADFLNAFAHHLPGGGVGEPAKADERTLKPGPFQVDCLICHEASGHYSHELRYMDALKGGKLAQAASAAAGFGTVPLSGPQIAYDRRRFDSESKVSVDLTKSVHNERCYYCHTANTVMGEEKWHSDRDVHVRAGMLCVDCHRNGEEHMIVRGYEDEATQRIVTPDMINLRIPQLMRINPSLTKEQATTLAENELRAERSRIRSLTCRGCHVGVDSKDENGQRFAADMGGRLGAPRPLHRGLPPLHLEKLSCTACHSGPRPEAEAQPVQTAMNHKLGLPGQLRAENTPPLIVQPVFLRVGDVITPHRMVWPTYWGRINKEGVIVPITPAEIDTLINDKSLLPDPPAEEQARDPYMARPLTDEQITKILSALAEDRTKDQPVFVTAGLVFRLADGKLHVQSKDKDGREFAAARPYAWPFAHDVRPAGQSLGATGCAECHSKDSPIYFGTVTARGAVDFDRGVRKAMWELRGDDRLVASTFAWTFVFRPMLKYVSFASAVVVAGVLLYYGLMGLGAITCRARNQQGRP